MSFDERKMTKNFEGFREYPYRDTKNKLTIGYGFNMDDPTIRKRINPEIVQGKRGITTQEADSLFNTIYNNAVKDAIRYVGPEAYMNLTPIRKSVLHDMAYNLGINKLNNFVNLRNSLMSNDYEMASAEMKDSNWYRQVGNRSKQLIDMMRLDKY